ncbi:MAG: hypothetical protein SF187_14755 [Deltaproteobacteria bacterium]|nr:hypothetical protein [Deltaproteobacteria bacterium]
MMSEACLPQSEGERVFRSPNGLQRLARRKQLLGIAGFIGGAVGFFVVTRISRADPITIQLVTTLPVLLGLRSFTAGRSLARTPLTVGVGASGVRVETARGSQLHTWGEIGWSSFGTSAFGGKTKRVRLYDVRGKSLVEFADVIGNIEEINKLVSAGIAAKGDDTADRIRKRKAKPLALFVLLAGLGALALGLAAANEVSADIRNQRRLADMGVRGTAEILELRLAPNGITPRLIYKVVAASGKAGTRNVQIDRRLWDALANVKRIPVFYVPDDPEVSSLAFGEVNPDVATTSSYIPPAILGLMGVAFIIVAAFVHRGFDIRFDTETKRFSLKKFGQ